MINESRQCLELFPTGPIEAMIKTLLVSRRFEVLPQTVEGHVELVTQITLESLDPWVSCGSWVDAVSLLSRPFNLFV